jgi:hypothetical protein
MGGANYPHEGYEKYIQTSRNDILGDLGVDRMIIPNQIIGKECLKRIGCKTWSLTLREENRLRVVFESRVLRRIINVKVRK